MKHFLTGIGLGAAIGILLAPESGRETRKKLMNRASDFADRLGNTIEEKPQEIDMPREQAEGGPEVNPDPVADVLNSASQTQLRKVPGIGEATARRIIDSRPFENEAEVVEKNLMPDTVLKKLKDKLVDKDEGVA